MKQLPTILAALGLGALSSMSTLQAAEPKSAEDSKTAEAVAKADLEQRMEWFNNDRFGMFIHWGTYSILGGVYEGKNVSGYAEWIQSSASIPTEKYAPLAKSFNPKKYKPEQWVLAAKKAGMKYVVITTKHHDGFCLWPSDVTTYDIDDASPFKRDILAELSAACKKHGLKFGTYYSIIDWHHPSQEITAEAKARKNWGQPKMKPGRKKEYVDYMKAQIKELIEKYDTDILWFDGEWVSWWNLEDGDDLYRYIRELKPSIIMNNRVSKRAKFKYDFGTPENETPGAALDHYWEACWTMNHTWGYSKHDKKWKSDTVLIQKLVDIVSKGGNLLLNVGPLPDGTLQNEVYQGLGAMGDWMKTNGESVYGTKNTAVVAPPKARLTAKGDNKLYLHIFDGFAGGKVTLPLTTSDVGAQVLSTGQKIPVTKGAKSITLDISKLKREKHITVVSIDLPSGYKSIKKELVELKEGDILLNATDAKILGSGPLRVENANHALGYWSKLDQQVQWRREIVVDGKFEVILVYALGAGHGEGIATVTASSGKEFKKALKPTKGWADFQQLSVGEIKVTAMKPEIITVTGKDSPAGAKALMNLRGVILRPTK